MARGLRSWLGGCLLVTALGMVPPPENVRMNSVNFKNILEWESPAFPNGTLTFTAQYFSYRKFQDRCVGTTATECDFSELSKYGDHTLRVRAELGDEHSDWVNVTFCPIDDTAIGPPGVQVEALANSLHIRFLAPRIENEHETWTMKNIYSAWLYHMQYWKNGSDTKYPVTCQYDFEVLRNLEPWTTYCVQVRGFLPDRNKTGQWSEPVCEGTISDVPEPPPAHPAPAPLLPALGPERGFRQTECRHRSRSLRKQPAAPRGQRQPRDPVGAGPALQLVPGEGYTPLLSAA
ncbi:interleukin-10 receptor subunit beta isoform X3 [Myotis daubentonii]|uniref:interleukin-10 receptor subunit beta isoform X3 n=1 Tax=Myotis daubentonii TaxID=98922 RepID=UPI002872D0DF|nr:interleukin-10 receptor subunit beta isoform X3 [Myotis daubentonii]